MLPFLGARRLGAGFARTDSSTGRIDLAEGPTLDNRPSAGVGALRPSGKAVGACDDLRFRRVPHVLVVTGPVRHYGGPAGVAF